MKTRLTKIFYVPGLISAVLIPLVFWYLGNIKLNEPIPNVMDLGISAKFNPNIPLNEQITLETHKNWNYKKIKILPNTAKENSKRYVLEIKNLQEKNKKNTGIEFVLNDSNSYNDFVSVLNDMAIAKHEIYGVDLDKTGHIFAWVDYKDPNKISEPCYLCNDVVIIDSGIFYRGEMPTSKPFDAFAHNLRNLPRNAFYLIFGYLILFQISVLSLLNRV